MRVLCKANRGANLPKSYEQEGYRDQYTFPLLIGKSYVVYAISLWKGRIRYLVLGESRNYPSLVPSELFEIVDSKLSRHWHYGINVDDSGNIIDYVWGYKELTDNSGHFDRLIDGDEAALEIFAGYKQAMDLEFLNPTASRVAEVIDNDWLLCPTCSDAWKLSSPNALVRCPNCGSILKNPNFKDP